jgi:hypothetical protein
LGARPLDALGISEDALRETVARPNSDEEVTAWVRDRSDPVRYPDISTAPEKRKIADRLADAPFVAKYPIEKTLPIERMPKLTVSDAKSIVFRTRGKTPGHG